MLPHQVTCKGETHAKVTKNDKNVGISVIKRRSSPDKSAGAVVVFNFEWAITSLEKLSK